MAPRSLSLLAVAPFCINAARTAASADEGAWALQMAQGENLEEWMNAVERNAAHSASFLENSMDAGGKVVWPTDWTSKVAAEAVNVGSGAFGKVFVADLTCDKTKVAIKEMTCTTSEANAESATLKEFGKSSYFTNFYAQSKKGSAHYIMMEPAMGGTLEKAYEDKTKTDKKHKRQLWYDMLAGVAEMHKKSVVHRDLKPANIFVTSNCATSTCHAKVGDLGLACVMPRSAKVANIQTCSGVAGTPFYIAPETFRSNTINPANDVWAMGMMLYEAEFAKMPPAIENSRTMPQLQNNIKNFNIKSDANFAKATDPVKSLLQKMLEPQYSTRITAAQALTAASTFNLSPNAAKVATLPECWATGQQQRPKRRQEEGVVKTNPLDEEGFSAYSLDVFTLSNEQIAMLFDDTLVSQNSGKVIAAGTDFPAELAVGDTILDVAGMSWEHARSEKEALTEGMHGSDLSVKCAKAE